MIYLSLNYPYLSTNEAYLCWSPTTEYVEAEGGFSEFLAILKESAQSESEEEADDKTDEEVVFPSLSEEDQARLEPLRTLVQKTNENRLNKYAFV